MKEIKTYGVIMAGGGGTRFWPLSRKQTPKQLLNLSGKEIMVNEAIDRLSRVVDYKNIFIVTNAAQAHSMEETVRGRVSGGHILQESAARNTAACIGFAAIEIIKKYGDGVMIITPSDAYIKNNEEFARVLQVAVRAAESTDKLVTIGINPTFAATGYGYIQCSEDDGEVKQVLKFVEKPDKLIAEKYIADGGFVWNSGMFVWKASVILQKFKQLQPEIYSCLLQIAEAFGKEDEKRLIAEIYPSIPSISVDYGILEKSGDILVVAGEFGWNDVGSWDTFNVLYEADENGNVTVGDALLIDSANTTVYSGKKLVAAVGVENLVVVETDDAVMVCPKDRAQDVKKIVDKLKENGRGELL